MYLKVAYLGLTLLTIIILFAIGRTAINQSFPDPAVRRKRITLLVLGLVGWQIYIFAVASTGILQNFDFPPRFFLLLILPAFIFTGIFIFRNRHSAWIQNIPEQWLVYYQSFRILIESIFVFSVAQGILHSNVTIEGYNYDMVFAFTAPLTGLLVFKFKVLSRHIALLWNYLGLAVIAVIIFLFLSTIYAPEIYGPDTLTMPIEVTFYPYILVAGFLMPSAVFVHVLSIVQLSRKGKDIQV